MKPDNKKKGGQKLLWKIHHWAGLYAGIVIGILCFTGAVAVFIPEISGMIQRHYYSVSSSPRAPGSLPKINNAMVEARRLYPAMSGLLLAMPEQPDLPATLSFAVKGKDKASGKFHTLFVDVGADRILGSVNAQDSFPNYLRQIHVRLYEGFWGRQLVGLAGLAFVVVSVTGLLIYGNFMKKQPYPTIRQKKGMRILMADWHKILGISALAFNFVIACTGAWLGLQPKLMKWFDIKAPNEVKLAKVTTPEADKDMELNWNEVFRISRREFPDLIPGYIRASEDGTSSIEIQGSIAGQVYERNINTIVLSKETLRPVFKFDIRKASFRDRFYAVQEALHFGDFGGLGLKILYSLLGLVSAFLSMSGFVVYLYRTDKQGQRKLSPLKTTFLYAVAILLVLAVISMVSLFIGYRQAATIAAWIVDGTLLSLILYAIIKYFIKRQKPKRPSQLYT